VVQNKTTHLEIKWVVDIAYKTKLYQGSVWLARLIVMAEVKAILSQQAFVNHSLLGGYHQ